MNSSDSIAVAQLGLAFLVAELPLMAILVHAASRVTKLETQINFVMEQLKQISNSQTNHWG